MRKIFVFALLLLSAAGKLAAQQDAQYSQYMFNGMYINPAYAGYKEVLNLHSYYRAQWTGIEGAPRSFSVAADGVVNDGNVGLGLQISSDKLGAQSTQSAYASYAYRIRMNEEGTSRLSLGLGVGVAQLGIDGSLMHTLDPEMEAPVGKQQTIVPDARAGIYYADERFFLGFSADNLVASRMSKGRFTYIPQPRPHFYLTGGMLMSLGENIHLKPSFLFKDDTGGPTSLDLNAFVLFGEKLWLGGSYRTGVKLYEKANLQKDLKNRNAAVAAIEVFPTADLRIGYAYDFAVGALQTYTNGSHEISIAFSLSRAASKAKGLVACPKFF
ncbi:type IX secretion system membrane protein PorP/SprF [Chitinophaga horti]|uniref:Type IX secretion system membrane protein PorP/SprF n=1 Tax=Chitinophaga horti TaxID=2920382 RepID=A0ABY6J788_9BACT|nr:type IX secretion system membrane protein PorP/SprF [Chitinophaga horti]UYQ95457.1 type IX secretion system membrane protein PorP/SprF [Chitinophaga horti]